MKDNNYSYCIGTTNLTIKRAIIKALSGHGFVVSGEAKNIDDFLRTLRMIQPWLAIIDTGLPPGNTKHLYNIIKTDNLAAALFINTTNRHIEEAVAIDWPFEKQMLIAVATTMCKNYSHVRKLSKKIELLQKQLEERKIIEKAKMILIKTRAMDEKEAHRFIQVTSMKKRISIARLSSIIIKNPFYDDEL